MSSLLKQSVIRLLPSGATNLNPLQFVRTCEFDFLNVHVV